MVWAMAQARSNTPQPGAVPAVPEGSSSTLKDTLACRPAGMVGWAPNQGIVQLAADVLAFHRRDLQAGGQDGVGGAVGALSVP